MNVQCFPHDTAQKLAFGQESFEVAMSRGDVVRLAGYRSGTVEPGSLRAGDSIFEVLKVGGIRYRVGALITVNSELETDPVCIIRVNKITAGNWKYLLKVEVVQKLQADRR